MLNAIVSSHCFLLSPESAPYALFDEGFEYGVRRVLMEFDAHFGSQFVR